MWPLRALLAASRLGSQWESGAIRMHYTAAALAPAAMGTSIGHAQSTSSNYLSVVGLKNQDGWRLF